MNLKTVKVIRERRGCHGEKDEEKKGRKKQQEYVYTEFKREQRNRT